MKTLLYRRMADFLIDHYAGHVQSMFGIFHATDMMGEAVIFIDDEGKIGPMREFILRGTTKEQKEQHCNPACFEVTEESLDSSSYTWASEMVKIDGDEYERFKEANDGYTVWTFPYVCQR